MILRKPPKSRADGKWRRWYAWRPVTTQTGILVWLEPVERRYECSSTERFGWWSYRTLLEKLAEP